LHAAIAAKLWRFTIAIFRFADDPTALCTDIVLLPETFMTASRHKKE